MAMDSFFIRLNAHALLDGFGLKHPFPSVAGIVRVRALSSGSSACLFDLSVKVFVQPVLSPQSVVDCFHAVKLVSFSQHGPHFLFIHARTLRRRCCHDVGIASGCRASAHALNIADGHHQRVCIIHHLKTSADNLTGRMGGGENAGKSQSITFIVGRDVGRLVALMALYMPSPAFNLSRRAVDLEVDLRLWDLLKG